MKLYFYIDNNGIKRGPIQASLLKKHGVGASTYVWSEGMSYWAEAAKVPELRAMFPIVPPPPTPPIYHSSPTSTNNVQCPYCKSYSTSKLYGKNCFRYVFVFGAALIGMLLTPIGSFILGRAAYDNTADWNNWECNSCKKEFKR